MSRQIEEIEKLGKLKDQNIITEEEFQNEKSKILHKNEVSVKTSSENTSTNKKSIWLYVIVFLFFPLLVYLLPLTLGSISVYLVNKKISKTNRWKVIIIIAIIIVSIVITIPWIKIFNLS